MATYEFDGEKYKQASRHQKEWGSNLISQLHLSGAETVLALILHIETRREYSLELCRGWYMCSIL